MPVRTPNAELRIDGRDAIAPATTAAGTTTSTPSETNPIAAAKPSSTQAQNQRPRMPSVSRTQRRTSEAHDCREACRVEDHLHDVAVQDQAWIGAIELEVGGAERESDLPRRRLEHDQADAVELVQRGAVASARVPLRVRGVHLRVPDDQREPRPVV